MKRNILSSVFLLSILWSQYDDIPFDWSGQYGVLSNNGQLMWNQDWQIGALLIDGTFTNYPTRFGDSYRELFNAKNLTDSYCQIRSIPDTVNFSSIANYYRGDFSYDQLEIDFDFETKYRIISLNGFKRSYSGPYGQYIKSDGSTNPLHQSYRIDYSSINDSDHFDLSIGYFYTDSRLNLNDPADFNHKERTTSVGIGYSKDFEKWYYKSYAALFQQYYSMSYDTTKAYLNRININQSFAKKLNNGSMLNIALEFDNQDISVVDDKNINRSWSTLFGAWSNNSTVIRLGGSISKDEYSPYFSLKNKFLIENFGNISSAISYSAKPKHLFYYSEDDILFEQWVSAAIKYEFKVINIPFNIDLYLAHTDSEPLYRYTENPESLDISDKLISASFDARLPLIRTWSLDTKFRHIFEHNLYSDGISDKITVGLNISENIFKSRLHAKFRLWTNGYFNHEAHHGYDGFHYGPYLTDNTEAALPDYWVFNLELAATVSKMTIGWKVNNILQTYESLTERIFPDLNENFLLPTNSNNFPPMNRFVTLNIIWEFEN